jgi:hypothetical protein
VVTVGLDPKASGERGHHRCRTAAERRCPAASLKTIRPPNRISQWPLTAAVNAMVQTCYCAMLALCLLLAGKIRERDPATLRRLYCPSQLRKELLLEASPV